ncbi:MAG: methyltransferase domain-containing protein [Thermoleophilia bacterium]
MTGAPDLGGFSAVDRSADPAGYAAYLDGVRAVGAVGAWKERSFALLEPRPGAVIVDAGCGTGEDVAALARLVAPGGRAIGVDASEEMIARARERNGVPGARFVVASATALGLPDAAADGVRAERLLQHLDDPAAAVREMARVLRPGGVAVVADGDWDSLVIDAEDLEAARALADAAAGSVRSPAVGRGLRRMMRDAGLADVEVLARTLVVTDLATADLLFGLPRALEAAVAAGALDAERAARLRAGLRRDDAAGRHLVAMTSFMARGRAR